MRIRSLCEVGVVCSVDTLITEYCGQALLDNTGIEVAVRSNDVIRSYPHIKCLCKATGARSGVGTFLATAPAGWQVYIRCCVLITYKHHRNVRNSAPM